MPEHTPTQRDAPAELQAAAADLIIRWQAANAGQVAELMIAHSAVRSPRSTRATRSGRSLSP